MSENLISSTRDIIYYSINLVLGGIGFHYSSIFRLIRFTSVSDLLTDLELTFNPLLVPLPVVPLYLLIGLQGLDELGARKICLNAGVGDSGTGHTRI